jgi:hypothetical protein
MMVPCLLKDRQVNIRLYLAVCVAVALAESQGMSRHGNVGGVECCPSIPHFAVYRIKCSRHRIIAIIRRQDHASMGLDRREGCVDGVRGV